ncbi:MAG: Ig-like domain-containing protein [Acholeplasmataceae bacterium]|nr:Ig-like domain-containing protein [Acholeplasmataceae bacterium]
MRNQIKSKLIALFSILTIVLVGVGVSSKEVIRTKETDAAVENWTKITGTSTSAFVGGNKYLLTYGNSYLVPGAYSGKNPSATTFALSSVQESAAWTFVDKGSGNWHIHDGTNYLKIETNNTSGLRTQTSAPSTYFTIASSGSDTWQFKTTSTGNRCPAYYAAGPDWRSYAASNTTTKLTVYKYVPTTTVPVTGISLNKSSLSLYTEDSEKLIATVSPSNASDPTVNWTSSNPAVASVSADGTVTGVTVGNATITAKTVDGGFTKTCAVTVTQNPLVIDKFSAKGFGGYAGGFDLNDHMGTIGVADTSLALRVFNGGTGAIRGNQSGIENNFSMRNIDRYPGYIRKIIITGTGGTSFTASATRSLVNVGDTPYSLDNATSGTKVQGAYTTSGGSFILTWEIPSNVNARYFIMHNLQAGGTMLAAATDAIQIFYEPVEDTFGTLDYITVDSSSSSLKKTYHVGEALTTMGLLVTAYDTEGRDLITTEYATNPVVGYRFKQGDLGTKTINVTVTIDNVSKSGSYAVSVIAAATYNKVNSIVDVICGQVYVMASPLGGAAGLDFTTFAPAVEIVYDDNFDSFTEVTNLQKLTLEIGSVENSYAI